MDLFLISAEVLVLVTAPAVFCENLDVQHESLLRAGFEAIRIDGGLDGRPFEKDADERVVDASF
jgi:hypothetical protein